MNTRVIDIYFISCYGPTRIGEGYNGQVINLVPEGDNPVQCRHYAAARMKLITSREDHGDWIFTDSWDNGYQQDFVVYSKKDPKGHGVRFDVWDPHGGFRPVPHAARDRWNVLLPRSVDPGEGLAALEKKLNDQK